MCEDLRDAMFHFLLSHLYLMLKYERAEQMEGYGRDTERERETGGEEEGGGGHAER